MRIAGLIIIMMFLSLGIASATTVNLTNGSAVQGDIIKQDNKSLQINVDGVTMTYYADEIKDIDGQPFATAPAVQPEATAPVVAAQPEVAAPVVAPPVVTAPVVNPPVVAPPVVNAPVVNPPAVAPEGSTIDPDKKALILQFMDVFGTRQALTNNFSTMIAQIAKDKPDEAQTISQRVKVDEIIDRLLPIYDRNFTADDLKAFIAFYGSPAGQKLIQTIPKLMKESVIESIKYMREKFPEINQGK